MVVSLGGRQVYAFTGGKPINPDKPTVIFVHGAALDHTVWTMPARHFARHGLNVLAVDLPGHGRSEGPPMSSIEAYANWITNLASELELKDYSLVGHSMGSLVCLQAAAYSNGLRSLVLVGIAVPMRVSDVLLAHAKKNNHLAIDLLTAGGHSPNAHIGGSDVPGIWMIGSFMRLMESSDPGVLHNDLDACNNYKNGVQAAERVECPSMLILGENDFLTPVRMTFEIAEQLKSSKVEVLNGTGHAIMSEKPNPLLDCLRTMVN